MAIALYLARRYGDAGPEPLYPHGPQAEADIWRWSLWAQGHLEPWVQRDLRLAHLYDDAPAAMRDEALRSLVILERALATRAWLCAGHFTVGDLNVASVLSPSRSSRLPLAEYPAVASWLARCYGLPAASETRARYA
jgi:glutathione S-transferase